MFEGLEGRPTIVMPAAHFAHSLSAEVVLLASVAELVHKFTQKDEEILRIMRQSRIIIIPSMNPDGHDYLRS